MHILQVSPRYPPATGGIERHVKEITERLSSRGHDVSVLTTGDGLRTSTDTVSGTKVTRVPTIAPGGGYHISPMIATRVRKHDADLVHAHGYHSFPLLFGALGAGDKRLVATPHYLGHGSGLRGVLHDLYRPVGEFALHSADEVIAVSDWERDQLSADFDIDPRVIPNGIDVEGFSSADPHQSTDPYIFCASRLVESKGIQYVIDALVELPEYELYISGTGPYREALEERAIERGVEERVRFVGYVSDDRLQSLFAGAVCHVTLSEFECYGLTPGESLAAGTPVVVYDRTALSDWTNYEGCIGVDHRDPKTVAQAIRTAADHTPSPAEVPRWDDVVDRIDDVYLEILRQSDRAVKDQ